MSIRAAAFYVLRSGDYAGQRIIDAARTDADLLALYMLAHAESTDGLDRIELEEFFKDPGMFAEVQRIQDAARAARKAEGLID